MNQWTGLCVRSRLVCQLPAFLCGHCVNEITAAVSSSQIRLFSGRSGGFHRYVAPLILAPPGAKDNKTNRTTVHSLHSLPDRRKCVYQERCVYMSGSLPKQSFHNIRKIQPVNFIAWPVSNSSVVLFSQWWDWTKQPICWRSLFELFDTDVSRN